MCNVTFRQEILIFDKKEKKENISFQIIKRDYS